MWSDILNNPINKEGRNDLKPCPFCGGEAEKELVEERKGISATAYCMCCGASISTLTYDCRCEAMSSAQIAWNRRAEPENKHLTLDELRVMENTPIWIVERMSRAGKWSVGLWAICNGFEWRQGHVTDWITFGNYGSMICDEYGKTWFAYRQKPEG